MAANVGPLSNFESIARMHKASTAPCGTEDVMHAPTRTQMGVSKKTRLPLSVEQKPPTKPVMNVSLLSAERPEHSSMQVSE